LVYTRERRREDAHEHFLIEHGIKMGEESVKD